jgi:hypothetical protein
MTNEDLDQAVLEAEKLVQEAHQRLRQARRDLARLDGQRYALEGDKLPTSARWHLRYSTLQDHWPNLY